MSMKKRLIINSIILTALTGIVLSYLLRSVSDPDFFWHIATGRWIWDNHRLPSYDPFSYTTPALLSSRELFILRSYWLSQLLYWSFFKVIGFNGIILIRFIVAGLLIYIIYRRNLLRDIEDRALIFSLLIVFSISLLSVYPLDRPQVWSFVFFGILLYLLDIKRYGLIPLLMPLWSNMHGGYILGSITIAAYMASEFFKEKRDKKLFLWGSAGIISGFINPCTYNAIVQTLIMPSSMRQGIVEYQSTINAFFGAGDLTIGLYWLLLIIATTGLLIRFFKLKIVMPEHILLAGLGYFSFTQIRYVAFFLIWAIPVVAETLGRLKVIPRYLILSVLLGFSLFIFVIMGEYSNLKNVKNLRSLSWVSGYYPDAAFKFIKENNIKGNMYNHYDWGGYLIWRFYPEKKVFIDGRQLYEYLYMQSMSIDNAVRTPEIMGMPFWKAILESYRIEYILIPVFSVSGQVIPLVSSLLDDTNWVPVFFRGNSVVFVKSSAQNSMVIYKYSIPKNYLIDDLIGQVELMLKKTPKNISLYIAMGDLQIKVKRYDKARESYERGLRISPFNLTLKERLKDLEYLLKHH